MKHQALNFAVKLALRLPEHEPVQSLSAHVLQLARFDLALHLRDRARFLTAILGLVAGDASDEPALVALRSKAIQGWSVVMVVCVIAVFVIVAPALRKRCSKGSNRK